MKHFFVEKYGKKCRKLELIFLVFFLQFFVFFLFLDKFLNLLWLSYYFARIWEPYWLKKILFRYMCFCNIKNINFFQFLSQSCL